MDAIFSVVQSARREAPALIPGAKSPRGDLYLPCWKCGRPAALDVTVISPLQKFTVKGAASYNTGSCTRCWEERKWASRLSSCYSTSISFIPLVVKTLGGWSRKSMEIIVFLPGTVYRLHLIDCSKNIYIPTIAITTLHIIKLILLTTLTVHKNVEMCDLNYSTQWPEFPIHTVLAATMASQNIC